MKRQQDEPKRSGDPLAEVVPVAPVPRPGALRLQKILVPIDFSDTCKAALRYAVPFAERFHAGLNLVYVVPTSMPAELSHIGAVLHYRQMAEDARVALEEFRDEVIGAAISIQTAVLTGGPYHEITEMAKSQDMDLIVMGTHGHSGLKHVLLGSTAERVVRYAPCPVLVVHGKGDGAALQPPMRRILVPVDFSKRSLKALDYACALATEFGTEILLLHVIPLPRYPEYGYAHMAIKEAGFERKARAKLESLRAYPGLPPGGIREMGLRTGDPSQEIIEEAQAQKCDLIVLSTHGHTGLAHVLLGSTAERVVRHAPVPVLVVREREQK